MILLDELKTLCVDRLEDAKTLLKAGRHDGAFYMAGYVVELKLKQRICETLGWAGYPSGAREFDNLKSFKTHDLEVLLHLSGVEAKVKSQLLVEWSVVNVWSPEIRYSPRKQTDLDARNMVDTVETLLERL